MLNHQKFVYRLKKVPGEYERFKSDLYFFSRGYNVADMVETELIDGVYRPMVVQPESLLKKYEKEIGDLKTAIKLENIK